MQLFRAFLIFLLEGALGLTLPTADVVPLFSHIPKNGGTWVTTELHKRGLRWFDPGMKCWTLPGEDTVPCTGYHVPVGLAIDKGCANPYYTGQQMFAVLRHPYARAVSQWTWGSSGWTRDLGYENTASGMNKFIQDSISNATVSGDEALSCRTSFPWHHGCGRYLQDCHWLPQSDYIFDGRRDQPLVTTLLNHTTLTQEILALLGAAAPSPGEPDARSERDAADAELASVMEDGATASVFAAWLCALTEQTKRMLDRHYAVDFQKFGHLFNRTNYLKTPCQPEHVRLLPALDRSAGK